MPLTSTTFLFGDCWKCGSAKTEADRDPERKFEYIYCSDCRSGMREARINAAVEALDWPDIIDVGN